MQPSQAIKWELLWAKQSKDRQNETENTQTFSVSCLLSVWYKKLAGLLSSSLNICPVKRMLSSTTCSRTMGVGEGGCTAMSLSSCRKRARQLHSIVWLWCYCGDAMCVVHLLDSPLALGQWRLPCLVLLWLHPFHLCLQVEMDCWFISDVSDRS